MVSISSFTCIIIKIKTYFYYQVNPTKPVANVCVNINYGIFKNNKDNIMVVIYLVKKRRPMLSHSAPFFNTWPYIIIFLVFPVILYYLLYDRNWAVQPFINKFCVIF